MIFFKNFPRQQLSFSQKNKEWRKKHLDWADGKVYFHDNSIRKSFARKKINYNLVNGYLDLDDMALILNPDNVDASYVPENIQHYPIINSKLNVLRGEESKRRFDWKAIVTNPNAITEIEDQKKELLFSSLQESIQSSHKDEESFNKEMDKLGYYFTFEYQDAREERANCLLNHYIKELSIPMKFNNGFNDAMTVGEELYQCDVVSGEPTLERINPLKLHAFKNGYSNRIEDADILVYVDFWSPGKIIDTFYDSLSKEDVKYLENMPEAYSTDSMSNFDERVAFANIHDTNEFPNSVIDSYAIFAQNTGSAASTNYYDNNGNVRVLRVYWKSRRKIKKVKSYNPETGDEEYDFYPETYFIDKDLGEEETTLWINEAWEGTKIGKEIYVNMRPRPIQYNRMSNPSKCHFGIIGTVYNTNENKPFSLVDIMKPYAYLYDAIHDRLNKAIAANWGKIMKMDLSMVPKGWEPDKWLYYAKVHKVAVVDGFKEGNIGAATGKLAGMMQQSSGAIDADQGNYIQQHINLLEFIKAEMSEAAGISKQREGQVSSSETVGGVERATLQSSHITEWLFALHENTKKRALECFLETAKFALKGRSLKFQYILGTGATKIMDIDGDEFSENDYGIVVDSSPDTQRLNENLTQLAHAALQNQTLSFSTIMKIFTSPSLSEIQRIIEKDERDIQERQAQQAQEQSKMQEKQLDMQQAQQDKILAAQDEINQRDNETKILIKEMDLKLKEGPDEEPVEESSVDLMEKIRQFDKKMALEREQFIHKKTMDEKTISLKEKDLQIKKNNKTNVSR